MAVTRINNNQISDASAGNAYVGINAATKVQPYSITATKIANNLTYGSDLTITGNLTVQQWGSISCKWQHWSRLIDAAVFTIAKNCFCKNYAAFI